jgi:ABC-type sugar transport system ATPase subunit
LADTATDRRPLDDPSTVKPNRDFGEGMAEAAVEVHELTKRYPGTVALNRLNFSIRHGEVRALVGKNGAGKSTFVEILSGTIQPDTGTIWVNGQKIEISTPAIAQSVGFATVHQEFSLFPDLTVAENMLLNRRSRYGVVSHRKMVVEARAILREFDVALDPHALCHDLSIHHRQLLEIVKALSVELRILILDEPTTALQADEVAHLFDYLRRLAAEHVAIIYISHRLDEIPRIADSVTVLRDGNHAGTFQIDRDRFEPDKIVQFMVGDVSFSESPIPVRTAREPSSSALSVRGLTLGSSLRGVDLELRRREIVGLWGLDGSGRSELLRSIFGLEDADGTVIVNGKPVRRRRPKTMIRRGVGFLSDDRKGEGLVGGLSVAENLVLASHSRVSHFGVLSWRRIASVADRLIEHLAIKTPGRQTLVAHLSGGNQQKVVIGRWLAADAQILLLDEPTKGIDIEAKANFYGLLEDLAARGLAILMAPTEVEELFEISDRIVALRSGTVVCDLPAGDTDQTSLMLLTMGAAAPNTSVLLRAAHGSDGSQ